MEFRSAKDLLHHIQRALQQQTTTPLKASAQKGPACFPHAHASPSIAAVRWSLGGPVPLWEKHKDTARENTNCPFSSHKESTPLFNQTFLLLGFFFPLLLFWFLSYRPIYSAEPTHQCSEHQPWYRGAENTREATHFGSTKFSHLGTLRDAETHQIFLILLPSAFR